MGTRRAPTSWRRRWDRLVAPRPDGLPNARVLWALPALMALAVATLTAFNLNGSSTGVWRRLFYSSPDPDILLGRVRPIRSDEWQVQSSWVVSQASQGFPHHNHVFPGGMDATLMNDLPTWDWSGLFRPHTWGFLLFGLDHGMAVRWWLPAALMVSAAYFFTVTLLPRRPLLATGLSLAIVFQPDVQWWWLPIVPDPIAFSFAAMGAVVWGYRCRSRWGRVLPALAAGYLAVDMAMGIYVPFMIPAVLAAAAFVVGFAIREWRVRRLTVRSVLSGLAPLTVCGIGALVVVGVWVATRRGAVHAVTSTVYPGHRVIPPGTAGERDFTGLLSGPFQRWLQFYDQPSAMGPNQSEASSALLVSLYLVIPLAWVVWTQWRRGRGLDWTVTAVVAVQALVVAYLYLPGWAPLAALTGLDRSVPQRLRLIFVILAVVAVALLVERLELVSVRTPWLVAGVAGAVVAGTGAWTWHQLASLDSPAVPSAAAVAVLATLVVGVLAVARSRAGLGVASLLVGALVVGAGVNPLNRGVFDLRSQTAAGRAVVRLHAESPDARWVAVGSALTVATLVEAGVPAYSGVQTYPAQPMWDQIDPSGRDQPAWNRLANVSWVAGPGDPDPRLPSPAAQDQVQLTFDSCAPFAQQYVTYVLADGGPIDQDCLRRLHHFRQGNGQEWIYVVRHPAG